MKLKEENEEKWCKERIECVQSILLSQLNMNVVLSKLTVLFPGHKLYSFSFFIWISFQKNPKKKKKPEARKWQKKE